MELFPSAQCQLWKSNLQVEFNKLPLSLHSFSAEDCCNFSDVGTNEQGITDKDIEILRRTASVVHSEFLVNTPAIPENKQVSMGG